MKPLVPSAALSRRVLLSTSAVLPALTGLLRANSALAQADPLPSWNDGATEIVDHRLSSRASPRRAGRTSCRADQRIATFDNDGTLWIEQPMYVQLAFALDRVKALAPQNPELEDQAAVQGGAGRRHEGAGRVRRKGPGRAHGGDARRHDRRTSSPRSSPTGSRPRAIRASSGPTPSWSTSRCWSCSPICAPTASRPSSSPAAASSSCGRGPRRSTAFRPSRSSARRSRRGSRCATAGRCCSACRRSISSTTRPASRSASTSTSAAGRSPRSATPTAISKCCNGRR